MDQAVDKHMVLSVLGLLFRQKKLEDDSERTGSFSPSPSLQQTQCKSVQSLSCNVAQQQVRTTSYLSEFSDGVAVFFPPFLHLYQLLFQSLHV